MSEVTRIRFRTASSTGLACPTRSSSHFHQIAIDDDRPVIEQPVRSALHDNLDRDAIYRCDALIESSTTVLGLRHESQVSVLCGARQLRLSRAAERPGFPASSRIFSPARADSPCVEESDLYLSAAAGAGACMCVCKVYWTSMHRVLEAGGPLRHCDRRYPRW